MRKKEEEVEEGRKKEGKPNKALFAGFLSTFFLVRITKSASETPPVVPTRALPLYCVSGAFPEPK